VDILCQIHRPELDLVRWCRPLPEGLSRELDRWSLEPQDEVDRVVSLSGYDLAKVLEGVREPFRGWMLMDVASLIARFCWLTGGQQVRLSLGVVRDDQCRKFHVDRLRFRMLCTYLGPGTEWAPEDIVDREALAHPEDCPCDANSLIVRRPDRIVRAAAGDVLLQKGSLHPERRGSVHRSPPIEEKDTRRVLLTLSTVEGG
jgi:hypothetical protein